MKLRFKKLFKKFKLALSICAETPKVGYLVSLQFFAGIANLVGLPLLIPVLDLMKTPEVTQSTKKELAIFFEIFNYLGVEITFSSVLLFAAGAILIAQCISITSDLLNQFVQIEIAETNRKKLFAYYFKAKWKYLNELKSGEIIFSVINEAEQASLANQNAVRVLMQLFQLMVLFLVACKLSFLITSSALAIYAIVAAFGLWNSNKIFHLATAYNQSFKKFSNDITCLLNNKKLMKVSPLKYSYSNKIKEEIESLTQNFKKQGFRHKLQSAFSTNFVFIFLVCIMYFHAYFNIDSSTLFVTLLIFFRISPMASEVSAAFARLDSMIPAHQSYENRVSILKDKAEQSSGTKIDDIAEIKLENVHFSYESKKVLSNISLTLSRNEINVIMGASGAGKSTLLDILLSLQNPNSGQAFVNQIPYSQINKDLFRHKIGYVGQSITLIEGTLRENLNLGNLDISEEQMLNSLKTLGLQELLESLPNGLDTELGEDGSFLSGGQKQRIALCRALLENCDLLILDEISSALDFESLNKVKDALIKIKNEKMIVIVTHETGLAEIADTMYYLESGTIKRKGEPLTIINEMHISK